MMPGYCLWYPDGHCIAAVSTVLGILFLCINTIQGMGKAIPSLVLTVCRQGLIFIPLIFILNHMFGLEGVIYAQPAADYLSIVVAILICTHLFRNMEHRNESVEE